MTKRVYIFAELHYYSSDRIVRNVVRESRPREWWESEVTQRCVKGNKLFRWVLLRDYEALPTEKEGYSILATF